MDTPDGYEWVEGVAFGHRFKELRGNVEDLVILEREGAIYSHFWDEESQAFRYYRIKFLPKEIFEYVEAHIARQEFLVAEWRGLSSRKLWPPFPMTRFDNAFSAMATMAE